MEAVKFSFEELKVTTALLIEDDAKAAMGNHAANTRARKAAGYIGKLMDAYRKEHPAN